VRLPSSPCGTAVEQTNSDKRDTEAEQPSSDDPSHLNENYFLTGGSMPVAGRESIGSTGNGSRSGGRGMLVAGRGDAAAVPGRETSANSRATARPIRRTSASPFGVGGATI
jgi:hypothetical protein